MSAAAAPRRGLLRAGLATLVAAAILVGLGAWQLERLAWKEALIATIAERMAAPPAPLPAPSEWPKLDLDQWRYRRVEAVGTFDPTREVRIYTLLTDQKGPYAGPGYWIIEPLRLRDGGTVLVNRGFVPESRADPASRPDGHTVGETTVVGLLREPEDRNMFTPADAPEKRLFFTRDPQAIAAALGLSDAAPFTIDADATPNPGGLPQGGETRLAFPNRHLEYALTWFGLAGALCAVFAAFAWQTLRPGRRR